MLRNAYFEALNHIQTSRVLVQEHLENSESALKELEKKAQDSSLQIMLFGAYNAGKSTLINALLGEERAIINDVPTTYRVDHYDWNGIHLLDTPGVNAPIEHEEASEEQLKRSGLILFVIRDGDMDAINLYERMFDLIRRGKKVFVALNNQLTSVEEKQFAIDHVQKILIELGSQRGVSDDDLREIIVLPINAKTACKGRLEGKEKLIEHSGFIALEAELLRWLEQQDDEQKKFLNFQSVVDELWYQPALASMSNNNQGETENQLREIRQKKDLLEIQRSNGLLKLRQLVNQEVESAKSTIANDLASSDDNESFQVALQKIYGLLSQRISAEFSDLLEKNFDHKIDGVSHGFEFSKEKDSKSAAMDAVVSNIGPRLRKFLTNPDSIKQALQYGVKKIDFLKNTLKGTNLTKFAGRAAGAFQVVLAAYDAHAAEQEEKKLNEQERMVKIQLMQAIDDIGSQLNQALYHGFSALLNQFYSPQINELQQAEQALQDAHQVFEAGYAELSRNRDEFLAVQW